MDAASEPQSRNMRVEFDPIGVPHRQLPLRVSMVGSPRCRVPRPDLMRVQKIEFPSQLPTGKPKKVANEIGINVVGVVLVLGKGPVSEHLGNPHMPKLTSQD